MISNFIYRGNRTGWCK